MIQAKKPMQITLSVLTYNDRPVAKSLARTFNTFPIIIGRSTSCDYYLEDPNQYVSSNHAVVLVKGDQLFISDTSSNGVYINGVTEPIGRKRTIALNDQDTLAIGAYKLHVTINYLSSNNTDNEYSNQRSQSAPKLQQPDPLQSNEPVRVSQATPERGSDLDAAPARTPNSAEQKSSEQQQNPNQGNEKQSNVNAAYPPNHKPEDKQPDLNLAATSLVANSQNVSAGGHASDLDDSNDQLKIILRAASLDESEFSHLENSALLEQTGRLLAQMVDAMMELLRSRAQIKKYIRSDNTTLSVSNNNPLKFSTSSADALGKLLANDTHGYLKSDEAIQDAVDDLTLHQLAMLEGMKLAVRSLLMKFEPNELAKKLEQSDGFETNTPISRKAKMWDLFCEQYDEIREEATGDFEALLGAEFRKVYELQLKIKGRNSKKSKPGT